MQADRRLRGTVKFADHEAGFDVADQRGTSSFLPGDCPGCISCRSSRLGRQPAAARACAWPLYSHSVRLPSATSVLEHVGTGPSALSNPADCWGALTRIHAWLPNMTHACVCLFRQDGSLSGGHSATDPPGIALDADGFAEVPLDGSPVHGSHSTGGVPKALAPVPPAGLSDDAYASHLTSEALRWAASVVTEDPATV